VASPEAIDPLEGHAGFCPSFCVGARVSHRTMFQGISEQFVESRRPNLWGASAISLASAYAVADVLKFNHSLHRKPKDAKAFYGEQHGYNTAP
jgi:hypothetical protein